MNADAKVSVRTTFADVSEFVLGRLINLLAPDPVDANLNTRRTRRVSRQAIGPSPCVSAALAPGLGEL
jgi:hypothetical protein